MARHTQTEMEKEAKDVSSSVPPRDANTQKYFSRPLRALFGSLFFSSSFSSSSSFFFSSPHHRFSLVYGSSASGLLLPLHLTAAATPHKVELGKCVHTRNRVDSLLFGTAQS